MQFENKVCVITGAANGIGLCIAQEFLKAGAKVACIDIDEKALKSLKEQYPTDNLLCVIGDITKEEVLNDFATKVRWVFSKVDILVNNACVGRKGILSDCSFDDFNYVLKLGVTTPYMLTKLFLNVFTKTASIINISSIRSKTSQPNTESYSAAKGGIDALTHALSISLSGKVRVNAISPGWIDTTNSDFSKPDKEQHPVARVGKPIDIVKVVMFLASEDSSFIDGQNLVVDGGMSKQMIYHNDFNWQLKV